MAKSFEELERKMSPEARTRSEAKSQKIIDEGALSEMRAAADVHPDASGFREGDGERTGATR